MFRCARLLAPVAAAIAAGGGVVAVARRAKAVIQVTLGAYPGT